jgi:tetratricopeptide (TPR) repeat protein
MIATLSERIAAGGADARLLTTRAYEHQALGNRTAALADFKAALALEPRLGAALSGAAEALLLEGAWTEARTLARRGLALDEDPQRRAPYHALLARIAAEQQRWTEALDSWRAALLSPQPEIDWFLGESHALATLGRPAEQIAALALAMQRNPSVVLRRAWIRALVESGDLDAASREIEYELARSRWRGSWLLLRARIHGLRLQHQAQRADAAAALAEIERRLHPQRPDPQLVEEANHARRLLGG